MRLGRMIEAARKRLDAVGICMVAGLAAFGGGTVRDLLLDRPVGWLESPWPIWLALATAVIVIVEAYIRPMRPPDSRLLILIADAAGALSRLEEEDRDLLEAQEIDAERREEAAERAAVAYAAARCCWSSVTPCRKPSSTCRSRRFCAGATRFWWACRASARPCSSIRWAE